MELVTKTQLAQRLGITRRGLNKLIGRGALPPPFAVGKGRYWRAETLDRWFAERERRAQSPPHKDGLTAPDGPGNA